MPATVTFANDMVTKADTVRPDGTGATVAIADVTGEYTNWRIGPAVIDADVVGAADRVTELLPVIVPDAVGIPALCVGLRVADNDMVAVLVAET